MAVFRTTTPAYRGQATIGPRTEDRVNLCDRIGALFRTTTPAYAGKPAAGDTGDGTGGDPGGDKPTGDAPTQAPKARYGRE